MNELLAKLLDGNEEAIATVIVSAVAGIIGVLGSLAASALPQDLLITKILARAFADVRNVSGKAAIAGREEALREQIRAELLAKQERGEK